MSKPFRLVAATGIHKGDREYQQDQVRLLSHARVNGCVLGILADGMGGRSGGRKASDQVMMTAEQLFGRFAPESDDPAGLLSHIVSEAHIVIRLTAISSEQEPHSTIAAFLLMPQGDCHWIHAGDSRIYHFGAGRMLHRTLDHSYVQALVNRGELTEEQAQSHPHSNILVGCLGADADPPQSTHYIPQLQPGDCILSCSDGVWHYFQHDEIATVVNTLTPRDASEFLIDKARARARGTGDNLSIAIVKLEALIEAPKTLASTMAAAANSTAGSLG